jgi:preprotein translocase subunit SecY
VFSTLLNIFKIPELRNKVLFTLGLLAIYRIGFAIPLPGIWQDEMARLSSQRGGGLSQAFEYFAIFTGGNLRQSTIFGLGIMPYITASIIFQLLGTVVPALEKLKREGATGQKKIQEYTRYATVPICFVSGAIWLRYVQSQGWVYPNFSGTAAFWAMGLSTMVCGTIFLMWLGEQIDEYGIGNGVSLIIMAGIVAQMPQAVIGVVQSATLSITSDGGLGPEKLVFLVAAFISVVAGSILITQAQRRIPIQQAKQMRGRRVYGGQRQYLPLRVNHGGVMPIIFASSMMLFPPVVFEYLNSMWDNTMTRFLISSFGFGAYLYVVFYVVLVYLFAYFWTTVQFQPKEMANQLRDHGSFIPGRRPGQRTAEYLEGIMTRITYVGAGFLALIAVIPMIVANAMQVDFTVTQYLGGTGLLIVVSVGLDLVQRIEANLIMRNYQGFLGDEGPIKGSRT